MTIWQTLGKGRFLLIAFTMVALAAAIACSGDDDDDSGAAISPTGANAAPTQAVDTAEPLAIGVGDGDLGPYLTGAGGKALYVFTRDMASTSNCVDDCLQTWPPLLVEPGQAVEADSVAAGDFDSIETAAGLQVTYNGAPLYYFAADTAPGDTNGHLVGNVWFLARPETASTAYVGVDDSYLVGPTGMTLYLFANDTEGVSNCSGQCIANWPALTIPEGLDPTAVTGATGALGVLTRDDGTIQITYNGAPLYYYVGDRLPGDTTGDGVGGVWSLATP